MPGCFTPAWGIQIQVPMFPQPPPQHPLLFPTCSFPAFLPKSTLGSSTLHIADAQQNVKAKSVNEKLECMAGAKLVNTLRAS